MKFNSASEVESITWQMRLADYPRSMNRAKVQQQCDGWPPYSDDEVTENEIKVNVNDLTASKLYHDAHMQYESAFMRPDPLFVVNLDYGPANKRYEWGQKITKNLNTVIRRSRKYYELQKSVFGNCIVHGIGPSLWEDRDRWCPYALGVEDVLLPSRTMVDFENVPFVAFFRQYTARQIAKFIRGPRIDPGWNVPYAKACLEWADSEASALVNNAWPEVWSPEKMSERIKSDTGLYASDAVPTIDCFDFYFFDERKSKAGWKRRIVLDTWAGVGPGGIKDARPKKRIENHAGTFLYDSGDRVYGQKLSEICHFQFANVSAKSPYRYHSVRSFGFLLWAVCHLQNRLKCRFSEETFGAMLQYFTTNDPDDEQRVAKIDLVNHGVIPPGVAMVKAQDRWTIPVDVIDRAMAMYRQNIADNSATFLQDQQSMRDRTDETATRTVAKVQASSALVGAMMSQGYVYEKFRYQEMGRRFCQANSPDPEVREFRLKVLRSGVPESALRVECWDIQPVRVVGAGNRMVQMDVLDRLMANVFVRLDPEPQRELIQMYVSTLLDDYDIGARWVPKMPHVSSSIHDAELTFVRLMMGLPTQIMSGMNPQEYIESLEGSMELEIQKIQQRGGVATPDEIQGFKMVAIHIIEHLKRLAQDKAQKQLVKQLGDKLAKMMNEVKAFEQRLQQAMKAQQKQQQQGMDQGAAAKAQAALMMAKTKAGIANQSAAQRTAQKQIQFEQSMKQKAQEHQLNLRAKATSAKIDLSQQVETNRLKSLSAGNGDGESE